MNNSITKWEIENILEKAGLKRGDVVLVHSSLRSIGKVEGEANAIIDAFFNIVGKEGTIAMPSFCYSWGIPKPYFDVKNTPGRTGILTEVFRHREGTSRSLHPTHSVLANGLNSEEFLMDHLDFKALGKGSPIDRIAQSGGYVLLIGVTHTSNSTIHVGEAYANVKKFHSMENPSPVANVLMPDGVIKKHRIDCSASCSRAFNAVDWEMRNKKMITDLKIGNSFCYLMKGKDIINIVIEMIKDKPDILFCTDNQCSRCKLGREYLVRGDN